MSGIAAIFHPDGRAVAAEDMSAMIAQMRYLGPEGSTVWRDGQVGLGHARLVVMDEPAAALDPRAERDLFARLHMLGRDRMVAFISHCFASLHKADHIVVLMEGRVAEQGTHDELIGLGAVYAELYTLQAQQFG